MILSYGTLNRACKMNTKHDSLNVSEVIYVLVYQYFDCKVLIKMIFYERVSLKVGRQNERKICERK
jgi:hypothetical protein